MKKVFYYIKGQRNRTYSYNTTDTLKVIKRDCADNGCVLAGIYDYETGLGKAYSRSYTDYDIASNGDALRTYER